MLSLLSQPWGTVVVFFLPETDVLGEAGHRLAAHVRQLEASLADRIEAKPAGLPAEAECEVGQLRVRDLLVCCNDKSTREPAYGLCDGWLLGEVLLEQVNKAEEGR